ncbi:hypothetical protein [Pedobacter nutrimenti]|uniref:hypothetical protein n=1 Tax=Pedobacter nutrimenti TaxID=1241337 RepID=UPI00292DB490|nr:hypothetical protein [Pedobacter nutrimenti]
MKKIQILSFLLFTGVIGKAQTNIFPATGNVGIGNVTPVEKLDVTGSIFLRNMENFVGGGVGISFSSYNNNHPGPRIKSYLDYASGEQSRSRLVLSSYYGGYKDELTLMGGNVGIGTKTPSNKISVVEPSNLNAYLTVENNTVNTLFGAGGTTVGIVGTISNHPLTLYTKLNERMRITSDGDVGIGTTDPKGYKLAVAGNMIAESVKVQLQSAWPDYVFKGDYKLTSLQETKKYIKEKGHLPGIPSAVEVKSEGIDLGEMNKKLLQKIEELTLYLIQMEKKNSEERSAQESKIIGLKAQASEQQKDINRMKLKIKSHEKAIY